MGGEGLCGARAVKGGGTGVGGLLLRALLSSAGRLAPACQEHCRRRQSCHAAAGTSHGRSSGWCRCELQPVRLRCSRASVTSPLCQHCISAVPAPAAPGACTAAHLAAGCTAPYRLPNTPYPTPTPRTRGAAQSHKTPPMAARLWCFPALFPPPLALPHPQVPHLAQSLALHLLREALVEEGAQLAAGRGSGRAGRPVRGGGGGWLGERAPRGCKRPELGRRRRAGPDTRRPLLGAATQLPVPPQLAPFLKAANLAPSRSSLLPGTKRERSYAAPAPAPLLQPRLPSPPSPAARCHTCHHQSPASSCKAQKRGKHVPSHTRGVSQPSAPTQPAARHRRRAGTSPADLQG